MLVFMGRRDEAAPWRRRCGRPAAERLVAENPSVPGYRVNLALLLMLQGNLTPKGSRPSDSVWSFREAMAIYER